MLSKYVVFSFGNIFCAFKVISHKKVLGKNKFSNSRNAVKQEQVLMKDSAGFSSDLHELVIDVKENRSQCQQLVEKVQLLTESTQRDTDKNLQTREAHVDGG